MAALTGALLIAAGFVLFALTYMLFHRPQPHPLTQNDDFGGYVAVVLTAILAFGVTTLAENLGAAALWQLAAAAAAIALSLAVVVMVMLRAHRASPALTPPVAAVPRAAAPSRPRRRKAA